MESVAIALESSAGRGNHIALAWGEHRRTYAQLAKRSRALAAALGRHGLEPGDRVAAHLHNRGETFELYFACALAGMTLVPVSWRLTVAEVSDVLSDSGARLVFTQRSIASIARAAATAPLVVLDDDSPGDDYEDLATGEQAFAAARRAGTHLLLYTSGTTGRPKAVRLTHSNVLWTAWQQVWAYRLGPDAVSLIVAPTFNMTGINLFSIPTLLMGGTVVIQASGGWRAESFAGLVDRFQATHTSMVASQLRSLVAAADVEFSALSSLRCLATGGEHCPPELLGSARARWPHVRLVHGYGQTETGLVTLCADQDMVEHPSSVGRVVAGAGCRVVGPEGQAVGEGEIGQLMVAGPGVSPGYWNDAQLTAQAVRDGWFATGDLGRIEGGLVYLTGRAKDVIISGGQNVYPAEVERALLKHDAVHAVAVVGIPDETWGEAVAAMLVLSPGRSATIEEVLALALESLASYKKPRHVLLVGEIPRTGSGKTDAVAVARMLAAANAGPQPRGVLGPDSPSS